MKIGTKSVLYGAHCFFIHGWFVAWAWWRLYGFPTDPRLWVAFFVHDLGYIGKPNMDGREGESHPILGARIMSFLFDSSGETWTCVHDQVSDWHFFFGRWGRFCLYHSRFFAKKQGAQYSRLCVADKLSLALTPAWLYLPMVNASGEIDEYMKDHEVNSKGWEAPTGSQLKWYRALQEYLADWAEQHKDLKEDTWTPANRGGKRETVDENGVWQ